MLLNYINQEEKKKDKDITQTKEYLAIFFLCFGQTKTKASKGQVKGYKVASPALDTGQSPVYQGHMAQSQMNSCTNPCVQLSLFTFAAFRFEEKK